MRNFISRFIMLLFAASVIFYSCSDNSTNTTSQTTGQDSLLFSFDSLVYFSDSSGGSPFKISNQSISNCNITKFKLQCSFSTNDSTLNSTASVVMSNNYDTNTWHIWSKFGSAINTMNINETVSVNYNTPYTLQCVVAVGFVSPPLPPHKYVKAKNFKLYKTP